MKKFSRARPDILAPNFASQIAKSRSSLEKKTGNQSISRRKRGIFEGNRKKVRASTRKLSENRELEIGRGRGKGEATRISRRYNIYSRGSSRLPYIFYKTKRKKKGGEKKKTEKREKKNLARGSSGAYRARASAPPPSLAPLDDDAMVGGGWMIARERERERKRRGRGLANSMSKGSKPIERVECAPSMLGYRTEERGDTREERAEGDVREECYGDHPGSRARHTHTHVNTHVHTRTCREREGERINILIY